MKSITIHGFDDQGKATRCEQFTDLFGTWTEQDFVEFQENTADFSQVDPSDWR